MSRTSANFIVLGRVTGVHGVHGWFKVLSYTRPRTNLLQYAELWLRHAGEWRRFDCRGRREQGKALLVALEGIDDREQARDLIGADIGVPRERLPPLPPGEYYWCDLIGLEVVTRNNARLGSVVGLEETGAHDVLVVRRGEGEAAEEMIPYVPGVYVLEVDLQHGRLRVDWPGTAGSG